MATDIQLKRSLTAGQVPGAANVLVGEPVVNLADRIIFSKDNTGNIVVIGAGTTSNVTEGSNLYFSNARSRQALSVAGFGSYNNATGVITITGDGAGITVRNTQGSNGNIVSSFTSVTGINFDANTGFAVADQGAGNVFVSLGSSFKTINVPGQNSIVAVGEDTLNVVAGVGITLTTSNVAPKTLTIATNLTTANVAESASNQYFTTSRARASFAAGTNITIADGVISSTASGNNNNFEFDYGFIYDPTISAVISPIDYGSI